MKIFKVMPLFAALIALSACPTAPKGGNGGNGGDSQGPDVIVKPGDNLDNSGNIKPDAGSTTTKEFLEALGKGFRNTDLTPLSIKTNNGTYTYLMDGGTTATLDSLKSPTHAIFRIEMPIDDLGLVTSTQYVGITILDGKAIWQLGVINDYESDYPGGDAPAAQWKAYYEKTYAKSNIDWAKPSDLMAALAPAPADVDVLVAKVNAAGFKYLKRTTSTTTLEPFSLKSDGSFDKSEGGSSTTYTLFYIDNETTVNYVSSMGRTETLRLEDFRITASYGGSSSSFDIIAAKPNPALLSDFVAKVNTANFKYIKKNPSGPSTLEPFSLKSDGSFEIPSRSGSSEPLTSYTLFYIDNETAVNYVSSMGSTETLRLEEFRITAPYGGGSSFDIIAAKPNPALLSDFVAKVNSANLQFESKKPLFLNIDGSHNNSFDTALNVFYMLDNSTAYYVGLSSGAVETFYGLRGKKFGPISYDSSNGGAEYPLIANSSTAIQKSDTTDPAALPALKAALAGTYISFTVDNSSWPPVTNDGPKFTTIGTDGSFTDATLNYGSSYNIANAVLHSARSASEGRYTATINGADNSVFGVELVNGILYFTMPSLGGSSDINDLRWFSMSPAAKKN